MQATEKQNLRCLSDPAFTKRHVHLSHKSLSSTLQRYHGHTWWSSEALQDRVLLSIDAPNRKR